MMKTIAITTSSFGKFDPTPLQFLEKQGLSIVMNPHGRALDDDEVVNTVGDALGCLAGTERYSRQILQALAPTLKVISRCGTGMESIDQEAARDLGIALYNTPDAPTDAVAELALALTLDLLRHVTASCNDIKSGIWKKRTGYLLKERTIGIIGYGRIGKKVARLLKAFGAELMYHDPFCEDTDDGVTCIIDKDEFLRRADILMIHAAGGQEIIGHRELALMKPTSFLVNLARGEVVNEEALYSSLKDNRLAGAALDVFVKEPYSGPLLELDNVIATPHIASSAVETRVAMEMEAAQNLVNGLKKAGVIS